MDATFVLGFLSLTEVVLLSVALDLGGASRADKDRDLLPRSFSVCFETSQEGHVLFLGPSSLVGGFC